jgi:hypothetical protein
LFGKDDTMTSSKAASCSGVDVSTAADAASRYVTIAEYTVSVKDNTLNKNNILVESSREFSLEKLWSQERTVRVKQFASCLGLTLAHFDTLERQRTQNGLTIPCSIVRYLLATGHYLTVKDIEAFIVTFHLVYNNTKQDKINAITKVN